MLNEEISKEAVGQATRAAENEVMKPITHFMTGHFVRPTADMLVDDLKRVVAAPSVAIKDTFHPEHGEMKVRDLIRKDEGAQAIDIDGVGLRDFKRIANKYGMHIKRIHNVFTMHKNPYSFCIVVFQVVS